MIHHLPVNMLELPSQVSKDDLCGYLDAFNLSAFDTVAISCYAWSEHLINSLIREARTRGFKKKVVLGGYQIAYPSKEILSTLYPDCDIFIFGYAEQSLLKAILMDKLEKKPVFLNCEVELNSLPSPYLAGEMYVAKGQSKVRIETKRGCPYSCSFCAHRNVNCNNVHFFPKEKVFKELALIKEKEVKKVNFIDPTFNYGDTYLDVMREIIKLNKLSPKEFYKE